MPYDFGQSPRTERESDLAAARHGENNYVNVVASRKKILDEGSSGGWSTLTRMPTSPDARDSRIRTCSHVSLSPARPLL